MKSDMQITNKKLLFTINSPCADTDFSWATKVNLYLTRSSKFLTGTLDDVMIE
jgi:hypothetical protein